MEPQPSDPLKSPGKSRPSDPLKSPSKSRPSDLLKSPAKFRPSDQISVRTPQKLPNPPRKTRKHHDSPKLPDNYEMLLKQFDALDVSLKLLRLRKSLPVFSKVRVMVQNISDRRFTHQHLAQLKFLLPEELGVAKVLSSDDETRCMKYDLHLTLTGSNKRKRGSKSSCLRDRLSYRLFQFLRAHPEGTAIPEKELPELFNQRKQDQLLNTIKQSSISPGPKSYYREASETKPAQASHLSLSFKKHFSKRSLGNGVEKDIQSSSVTSFHSPSSSTLNPSGDESESILMASRAVQSEQPAVHIKQMPCVDHETSIQVVKTPATPIKSAQTPTMPTTPALQTPKICNRSINSSRAACNVAILANRPSCAKSLLFEGSSRSGTIELQLEEAECSDILDILPENLLQSLEEKEKKKAAEQVRRRQMIVHLPKMFDRIQLLFHRPKSSAIKKEALIRNLTECHSDITDESEIKEQLELLQEIIPEWIVYKFSPSGNKLCSINKALDPNTLRQMLYKSI